ncbi:nitroreductase family deazaflavin-dependent oxidoreductase [Nocardia cyriacigeorgica]|uniref:Nitroreductase family deazaflavin-dependent oxidoreductase n=1 Tax=Nocardia cyriacigeorgica TaxID=135487 RepID=A0A6P1DDG3_9NOCA|nr:nitroreductase family deazaflavin-dependent oxidoreductase [Nocardia cyriacigeorgica]NEW41912.1 nitroreductase family deazaflavin-dependent oxidoreductase [Nocardia cyriacigeorgica]NEW46432.1 nitroreductase family deazaflavin-dependent oxidoreductase [Nocardia cyriacigeorgica]NEW57046.1 nitroreductase family deazaflavin-dependent oxidoreductase [Nocardia cyriacigeorgica]
MPHDIDSAQDSPDLSVAEHVRRYLATNGSSGYLEGGSPNLILAYRGRTTGKLYRTGLFFGEDNDRYILIASGSSITHTHPQWYLNLLANSEVQVQVLAERFIAHARTAEGAERQRLWDLMTAQAPVYHTYAARSRRTIPVVVLERVRGV